MFCDGCGTALQPNQSFCAQCGKQVIGPVVAMQLQRGRVREHVRLLGILWLALSAFGMLSGMILFIVANTIFMANFPGGPPPEMKAFLHTLLSFLAVAIVVKALAGFAAGWGLLQRERWARVLALVVGFLALFNVPLGTALGVYTLWVLLPAQSETEYEAESRTTVAA